MVDVKALSLRGCQVAPDCQIDLDNAELLIEILVFGAAGAAGLLLLVCGVLAIQGAAAGFRRLFR